MHSRQTNERHVLNIFKTSIISFMDELIDQFPSETALIHGRILLKDQIPIEVTMRDFITKIERNDGLLKKLIKNKDSKFFLEHNIFSLEANSDVSMSGTTTNHFRTIWLSELDDHDREVMWKWFESFVALAEKYQAVLSSI